MKERKPELRKRILKLYEIGLKTKEISQVSGIPPRTVRYYLSTTHAKQGRSIMPSPSVVSHEDSSRSAEGPNPLSLRLKANPLDQVWIERLNQAGASIEEISDILRLSGREIFKAIRDQKPEANHSKRLKL
ncbi:MAG TPA: helix-turn-helix domain-containing protein [Thermodesulfobacteriota bacterium]|nr:helix-turn-helix domain-containing protein [Thermodesulfobacteriota bacterium]